MRTLFSPGYTVDGGMANLATTGVISRIYGTPGTPPSGGPMFQQAGIVDPSVIRESLARNRLSALFVTDTAANWYRGGPVPSTFGTNSAAMTELNSSGSAFSGDGPTVIVMPMQLGARQVVHVPPTRAAIVEVTSLPSATQDYWELTYSYVPLTFGSGLVSKTPADYMVSVQRARPVLILDSECDNTVFWGGGIDNQEYPYLNVQFQWLQDADAIEDRLEAKLARVLAKFSDSYLSGWGLRSRAQITAHVMDHATRFAGSVNGQRVYGRHLMGSLVMAAQSGPAQFVMRQPQISIPDGITSSGAFRMYNSGASGMTVFGRQDFTNFIHPLAFPKRVRDFLDRIPGSVTVPDDVIEPTQIYLTPTIITGGGDISKANFIARMKAELPSPRVRWAETGAPSVPAQLTTENANPTLAGAEASFPSSEIEGGDPLSTLYTHYSIDVGEPRTLVLPTISSLNAQTGGQALFRIDWDFVGPSVNYPAAPLDNRGSLEFALRGFAKSMKSCLR